VPSSSRSSCDLRIAGRRLPDRVAGGKPGLLPGAGGTQRLPRAIGTPAALMHILMGRQPLNPREAEKKGLVARNVSGKALESRNGDCRGAYRRHTPESLAYLNVCPQRH